MYEHKPPTPYARIIVLGMTAGFRSMTPLALLALTNRGQSGNALVPGQHASHPFPLRALEAPPATIIFAIAVLGEFIADKLPFIPSRLNRGPLVGRMTSGGLAGLTLTQRERGQVPLGLVLGASAALLGSVIGYQIRRQIGKATGVPDLVVALGEDGVALGLAAWATRPQTSAPPQ